MDRFAASHAGDPGSIPRRNILTFLWSSIELIFRQLKLLCLFDQILWPMLSSTKISCLTGVLNPGHLSVKPRLYHWAKLPLLKMRGKTVKYILHKYILGYFGNQQKATDQINSRLNKQQKTTDFKKQQISKTIDFKNSGFQKTDFKNNS